MLVVPLVDLARPSGPEKLFLDRILPRVKP